MADELQIYNSGGEIPISEENIDMNTLISAGDALSQAMLFALRRDYLDEPVLEQKFVHFDPEEIIQQYDSAFLEIEQVGKPANENQNEYFKAIQTTLASCHDPRYHLIFLISSDGLHSRIIIGVTAKAPDTQPKIFADQLGQFLCSNWPGTRIKSISDYKQIVDQVHVPLSNYRYARAFTGIPSPRSGAKPDEYPQSLDRLMRGLRGKPYIYMVVAEPIAEKAVNDIVNSCQTLASQVHAFTKTTIQRSKSSGITESTSRSKGGTITEGTSRSSTETETETKSKGVLGTSLEKSGGVNKGIKALGVAGISGLLLAAGGPFLLSGMMGMVGQLLPSTGSSGSSSSTTSDSDSISLTSSISKGETASSNESLSFGQEYLNKNAASCIKLLDQTSDRFEVARARGCWNVGVYLVSDQSESAAQAQAQYKALVSGDKSTFEPIRAHDLGPLWDGQVQASLDVFQQPPLRLYAPQKGEIVHHPLGEYFENLTTPMNTEELSIIVNLPLREMPGVPLQPAAYFSLNPPSASGTKKGLQLGRILEGGVEIGDLNYEINLDMLTRHVFITGITGSGKSNTCRRLITELMENGKNFLVIEPAKDEYVRLALAYNQSKTFDRDIAVYMPGTSHWRNYPLEKLQINPFDIVRIPGAPTNVMPHLDRLKSIFNASFPMYEILPVILEEALVDLYSSQGWLEEDLPTEDVLCPTLSDLYDRLTVLVRNKGYEERITLNITAAMKTRIGSLMRGWKGSLFNQSSSTPWADIFDRPAVINLQQMGDDADKCFTMALLLNFLYEYRQAQYYIESSIEGGELRHLAFIEEAHRILRQSTFSVGEANPQVKMGEMFADILAEIRAYGQGLAIIDQVPAKLIPDVIKNTNLKIIHRLVAADDHGAMASSMALTEDQTKVLARLKVGQAIVSGIQDDMASWVKVLHTPIPVLKS